MPIEYDQAVDECPCCGSPQYGKDVCSWCRCVAGPRVYAKVGLDANGNDRSGRNRSGLAIGYLMRFGIPDGVTAMEGKQ